MRKKLDELVSNKFFQGGLIITISSFIINFFGYLFNSITAKALGPTNYGEIMTTFSYLAITSIPFSICTALIIKKLGSAEDLRANTALAMEQWFWKKINQYKLLIVFFLAGLFISSRINNLRIESSLFLVFSFLISVTGLLYGGIMQGLHYFVFFALINIVMAIMKLTGSVLTLFNFGGLTLIYIFINLGGILNIVMGKLKLNKFKTTSEYVFDKRISHLFSNKKMLMTIASLTAISLLSNFDLIYVKKVFPAETAGIYSAWSLFAKVILYLLGSAQTISYIFFSDKKTEKSQKKALKFISLMILVIGVIIFAGYSFFGKTLTLLIFNSKYFTIIEYLPHAAIFGVFYTFITIVNGYFVAKNDRSSLIIVITMPLYIIGFIMFGKSLSNTIYINLIFSGILSLFYLFILQRNLPKVTISSSSMPETF